MKMDKLLEFFIKEPEKEFHGRQLSKILRKSPTTILKYLKNYEKQGVLKSEKKLNHLLFKANSESKAFRQLKLVYNLNILNEIGLIDYLAEQFNYPEAIVLFGSFAKAEDIPLSDVDLLVVSPLKKELSLEKYEKRVKHKIQLFVHSSSDIMKMKEKNKELLNKWINGIVLFGSLEVFR